MAYVKIENGVVVQKQPYEEDGFIECDGNLVFVGYEHDGVNFTAPVTIQLDNTKKYKKNEIMEARQVAFDVPTLYDGKHYDPVFLLQLEGKIAHMDLDPEATTLETQMVRTVENTNEQLAKTDLINRCVHLRARDDSIVLASVQMKEDVDALTTVAEVEAYTFAF